MAIVNVGQLIGEVCRFERAEADEERERASRDTTFTIARYGYRIMTPALIRWRGVESRPGVERLLAVCRDVFGEAKCETLKRLRDRLSIRLDCEPAEVNAMSLEEFLAAWKGIAGEGKTQPASDPDGQNAIERASAEKLFPKGIPDDPDVVDLGVRLNAAKGTLQSDNKVAQEYTEGDIGRANSLLSILRRLRRQGRFNR